MSHNPPAINETVGPNSIPITAIAKNAKLIFAYGISIVNVSISIEMAINTPVIVKQLIFFSSPAESLNK